MTPTTRPRPARQPKRTPPRTRPWPFDEAVTVIPIGGWIAESMPDSCDECEDEGHVLPFTATSSEPGWVIADYRCPRCGAEWACGWSALWAMKVTAVIGGELWEREWVG